MRKKGDQEMKIKLWFVILAVSVLCLTACASSDDTVITKVGDMEYPAGITQKEYDDALAKIQEHEFVLITPQGAEVGKLKMDLKDFSEEEKFATACMYKEHGFAHLEYVMEKSWFASTDASFQDFISDGKVTVSALNN